MPKKQKPKKSAKRHAGSWLSIIAVSLLTILVGLYLLVKFSEKKIAPVVKEKPPSHEIKPVSLYFSDASGVKLALEKRDIKKGATAGEIKDVIQHLIDGPSKNLIRTIPEGTRLLGIRFDNETSVLNFSPEIAAKHPGGSSAEIQTVYSIVNSVVFNFPEIKRVKILIDGKDTKTLAGHIDISMPLAGDKTK